MTPHLRGWTEVQDRLILIGYEFPAYAGIVRKQ